jgi:clan AA aspartic protease (TIGR02281 family)
MGIVGRWEEGLMLARLAIAAALGLALALPAGRSDAGYLDEDPAEVFAGVYATLGITLPDRAARDPLIWLKLEELKREPCDQKSISDLADFLEKGSYRRQAADALYGFVRKCGAPVNALHRSIDLYLKLTDYPKVVEVADEFVRRAPTNHDAHYLRGVGLEGVRDYKRALADYANAIELFGPDKRQVRSVIFTRMAEAYAALGQFCEAATPILTWVAIDPATRDNSRTQKIISDYESRGSCQSATQPQSERYPLRGRQHVVHVKATVNGISGMFVLDTGASYLTLRASFAERARIAFAEAPDITLWTANGTAKGKLAKADNVQVGKLQAASVPVVVQKVDAKSYGPGIDGLLGMSFLSRFELQMSGGYIEVRTRRRK